MEFFRHCPQCGHKFHIKLVTKKLEHVDRGSMGTDRIVPRGAHYVPVPEEGEPITIDIEEFRYAYKCKQCGHEWSEKHTEKHVEPKES
jgi:DNA-directed RNA polymerase subunit RPC12/RpoP